MEMGIVCEQDGRGSTPAARGHMSPRNKGYKTSTSLTCKDPNGTRSRNFLSARFGCRYGEFWEVNMNRVTLNSFSLSNNVSSGTWWNLMSVLIHFSLLDRSK